MHRNDRVSSRSERADADGPLCSPRPIEAIFLRMGTSAGPLFNLQHVAQSLGFTGLAGQGNASSTSNRKMSISDNGHANCLD
jgi:hypothetical protein